MLASGFGSGAHGLDDPILFSGCYFAATGGKQDRQAFVRGVLEKMQDEQEDVEWTDDALAVDRRRRLLTIAGWLLAGLLVLVIVAIFLWKYQ